MEERRLQDELQNLVAVRRQATQAEEVAVAKERKARKDQLDAYDAAVAVAKGKLAIVATANVSRIEEVEKAALMRAGNRDESIRWRGLREAECVSAVCAADAATSPILPRMEWKPVSRPAPAAAAAPAGAAAPAAGAVPPAPPAAAAAASVGASAGAAEGSAASAATTSAVAPTSSTAASSAAPVSREDPTLRQMRIELLLKCTPWSGRPAPSFPTNKPTLWPNRALGNRLPRQLLRWFPSLRCLHFFLILRRYRSWLPLRLRCDSPGRLRWDLPVCSA